MTLFMDDDVLTVGQLQRKAGNALARGFRGDVWVRGEVKSLRDHRGNWYISLVEPGDHRDGGDISLDVACWSKRRFVLQSRLEAGGVTLAAGMEVLVQGMVTLSKIGKLQLELHDLDTDALIGRQAADKRRLYRSLEKEGLLERNKATLLTEVPLRVGLVTSTDSDGFNDFLGELKRSAFAFEVSHQHSPVQGPTAAAVLARAIERLSNEAVDLVVVVRGGGGELDAFDKEPVARAIATCRLPVWTGVGHTSDHSVADDVAHSSFITPTACGQAVVARVNEFVARIDDAAMHLRRVAVSSIEREMRDMHYRRRHLSSSVRAEVGREELSLVHHRERLHIRADHVLQRKEMEVSRSSEQLYKSALDHLGRVAERLDRHRLHAMTLDPRKQLERGYALVYRQDGRLLDSVRDLRAGDEIVTALADGKVASTVTDTQIEMQTSEGQM